MHRTMGALLEWEPLLMWTHAGGSLLIAISALLLTAVLTVLAVWHRQELSDPRMFAVYLWHAAAWFGVATTQFLAATVLWVPLSHLQGWLKLVVGVVVFIAMTYILRGLPAAVRSSAARRAAMENANFVLHTDKSMLQEELEQSYRLQSADVAILTALSNDIEQDPSSLPGIASRLRALADQIQERIHDAYAQPPT